MNGERLARQSVTDRGTPLDEGQAKIVATQDTPDGGAALARSVTAAGDPHQEPPPLDPVMTSRPEAAGPLVIEGTLRLAGDGYEDVELYVDDELLIDALHALPHTDYEGHYWVIEPGAQGYEAWEPHERRPWTVCLDGAEPSHYVPLCALHTTWGRVRITLERLT